MNAKLARFILTRLMRWTIDDRMEAPEKTAIFLGVPHTSIWDFPIGYFYAASNGRKLHVMIKKEAFKPPFGWFIRAVGGFPVDRTDATSTMHGLISDMRAQADKDGYFWLCVCPEGTRKAIKHWKTGYHVIAREVGCPVYLCYYDWKTKHVGMGPRFEVGDDARADTRKIQEIYEGMDLHAKHPEGFVTH